MQFKHLSILALASLVSAQDEGNSSQSLNATLASTEELANLTTFLGLVPAVAEALLSAENITILAPSNDAFAEFLETDLGQLAGNDTGLLAAVLQYHVLNGTFPASSITNTSAFVPTLLTNETYTNVTGGQVVQAVVVGEDVVFYSGLLQNSTVTQADVNFTGGVVHIIDRVLAYPPNVLDAANALNLTSFRGAVNATNSIEAANGNDVTIFAPNNEAFNSIGSALANLSSEDLASIIAYHVLDQVYYSTDLENGTSLQTLDGDNEIQITINDGSVFVNSAQVVTANVLIANGVLHIIDNVLNPDNDEPPSETATAGEPGFTGSAGAGQPFTSGQPAPTQTVDPTEEGPGPAETEASTETSGAAMPLMTGGVEYVALFGAGAAAWLGF